MERFIIAIVGFILSVILIILRYRIWMRKSEKTNFVSSTNTEWQAYKDFKKSVKTEGLNYENKISYCNNTIIADDVSKKLFIITKRISDGRTLKYDDIASFTIYKNGEAIKQGISEDSGYHAQTCFDLHITITLKDGTEIVMPLIDSPVGYEYAFNRAMNAANEITAVLKKAIIKLAVAED